MTNALHPMEQKAAIEASFDLVARQDAADGAIAMLTTGVGALEAEMTAVKGRLDRIAAAAARPVLDGTKAATDPAARSFIDDFVRRGADVSVKSFTGATPGDGGFAVPREIDALIGRTLTALSPIRALATVVQTGSAGYRKLVTTGGTPSGWVSETGARPITATPSFTEIAPPTGELYANPAASQTMLDDAAFDVEAWLADEIAREFARAEGVAFVTGSGVNQPRGFLTGPVTAESDAVRAFGTLQHIASGAAGGFAASNPEVKLIDLVHALRGGYRQGATFVMNAATLATIRKFKTADGQFIWQPGLSSGQPDTLLGYPVVEAEAMPDIAANSLSIAFGNFREAYLVAERSATTILRDPFTNKPFVHFYATRRIGGQVVNSEAIKLMKFAVA